MFSEIDVGLRYAFTYPSANYQGVRCRRERRRILIERVRHLAAEPLDESTVPRDPLLCRGSILVTGIDLDKLARRSFYLESMDDIDHDCAPDESQKHRVYVFDPSGEVPPTLAFSSDSIEQALRWIGRWEKDPMGHTAILWPVGAPPPVVIRPLGEDRAA